MTDALFNDDAYLTRCSATVTAAGEAGVEIDRTVFYPEGGGQPGDSGQLILADGTALTVATTQKGAAAGQILHVLAEGTAAPAVGSQVTAEIDWARRHRHMRMHTCLHLLCALVEGDVTGGQIGDGKGRLDFNLPDGPPDKAWLEGELNRLIAEDRPATASAISDAELAAKPDLVRTMSVKPPSGSGTVRLMSIEGIDLQPCGGTHVRRTGEIGRIEVGKIENKGKQNRRINLRLAG